MINRISLSLLTFIFVLVNQPLWSLEKINSLEVLTTSLKNAGPETLVVFDCDMVLTHPDYPPFQYPNLMKHHNLYKKLKASTPQELFQIMCNGSITEYPSILVEQKTPDIIRTLQNQGVKTIVLSNALTGPFGKINDFVAWRVGVLKNFGLDFSTSFPDLAPKVFTAFDPTFGRHPEYRDGVIHASEPLKNNKDKGSILIAFLNYADYKPSRIIFIDDKKNQVEEVENTLKRTHPEIAVTGYEYDGAKIIETQIVTAEAFQKAVDDLKVSMQEVFLDSGSHQKVS